MTETTSNVSPLATKAGPSSTQLLDALRPVIDPELGISIVDLGLIYETKMLDDGVAHVLMTLTSPMCPLGPQIMGDVHSSTQKLEGVSDVKVELTFTPPWDPKTMADEDTQMILGIF
jgi:metal-sulfur cluster biosynthetic enzyme